METGVELIARERERQIFKEGWSPKHDDEHTAGQMAVAAIAYAAESCKVELQAKIYTEPHCKCGARGLADCTCVILTGDEKWVKPWPFGDEWWKPSPDPIRNLVKAGALIAAEIDRLQRLNPVNPVNPVQETKPEAET